MRRLIVTLSALALMELVSGSAAAYTLRTTAGGRDVHWPSETVTVVVDGSLAAIDAQAPAAVADALGTWAAVSDAHTPTVVLQDGAADALGYRPDQQNQNTIRYAATSESVAGSALGITVVTFDAEGNILDADIVLNGGGPRKFGVLDAGGASNNGADAPDKNRYDVQNVATHEAGHFFGLGENLTDEDATMFIDSARGETKKRDLETDDETGIRLLYVAAPSSATAGGCAVAGGATSGYWDWIGLGAMALGMIGTLASRRWDRRGAALGGAILGMASLFGPLSGTAALAASHDATRSNSAGVVVGSKSHWEAGLIVTALSIEAPPSAASRATDRIDVDVYGGTVGGISQIVGHEAVPEIGQRIALERRGGRVVLPSRFQTKLPR